MKILGLTLEERHEKGARKAGFTKIPPFTGRLYTTDGWKKLAGNVELSHKDWMEVKSAADIPRVEKWLLQGLVKDAEGFMSKHLERKISLSVTRLLVNTPVTPNQMTLFSSALGVLGALLFLKGSVAYDVMGALLFWLHSVLDGCDGEIARLKFKESRFGGILDFFGDNVVHSAVFACIAVRMHRESNTFLNFFRTYDFFSDYVMLGWLAVCGTIASAVWVYWTAMRNKRDSGPLFTSVAKDSQTSRFLDFLARRDFIYLVIILSFFGKIHWFLIMGAVGAPLYFLILIVLHLKEKSA
ncbi:MAG: hypothetical protein A2901_03445 [Elusimicrobia bacterium RIFCSPLOWO2_01_FULL_54_10]|nr:MAG: hypothetical protein A2901_03445 [Elusimicrobia bacterium RIFCSPLOWO2_01_FULL_54_10]